MKYYFTEKEKLDEENVAELDGLIFKGEYVEGEGKVFRSFGSAVVDGEIYNEFEIEFVLENEAAVHTAAGIFSADWIEYDFIFNN